MPLEFTLTPESTGMVFLSTKSSMDAVPNTPLPPDHPFHALWKIHLTELVNSPLYDFVIDAFVAICQGTPHWKTGMDDRTVATIQSEMRDLLHKNPPDVIAVDGMTSIYSCHQRRNHLWPFICMSFDLVTLWANSAGSQKYAGLTALLKTRIDHEIGHWLFTLVSIIFDSPKEEHG
jgi:hypothetical protein